MNSKSKRTCWLGLGAALLALAASPVHAAKITFDTVVVGATTFGFDGDGDGIDDVIFSTTDPAGFKTLGPGLSMTFINEPGLEGTSTLASDLKVDFLYGATGSITFGFALLSSESHPDYFASFLLFDASGTPLASETVVGDFTVTVPPAGLSSYPEGLISVSFPGVASYGTFNFTSEHGRYIIDNLEGTFGSTEVPGPGSLPLLGLGLGLFLLVARRLRG